MPQTSVATRMTVGLAGLIGNLEGMAHATVVSATSTEASAEIPFGVMVQRGTPDGSAKLLSSTAAAMAANNLLLGVVTHAQGYAEPQELGDTDAGGLKPGTTFGVLLKGPIYVVPEENVTPASDVRVRVVVTGNEVKGAFRATADASDCVEISAFARWMETGLAGSPTLLYIDMTNVALTTAD